MSLRWSLEKADLILHASMSGKKDQQLSLSIKGSILVLAIVFLQFCFDLFQRWVGNYLRLKAIIALQDICSSLHIGNGITQILEVLVLVTSKEEGVILCITPRRFIDRRKPHPRDEN